jgi:hypothetical protein
MAWGQWLGIVALLAGLGGCAHSPVFVYDGPKEGAWVAARSWALAPGTPTLLVAEGYREVRDPAFPERVEVLLQQQGLPRVAPERAELWLRVHLLAKQSAQAGGASHQGGQRSGGKGGGKHGGGGRNSGDNGAGARSHGPQEGSLLSPQVRVILELEDRITGARVWAGSLDATLQNAPFQEAGQVELQGLLAKLVAPLRRSPGAPR